MLPAAAADWYRRRQRLVVATLALSRKAWAGMGPDFDGSWPQVAARLVVIGESAQLGAARGSLAYLPAVLAEVGLDDDPDGELVPEAFVGAAGDGRPLGTLLYGAVVRAKESVAAGAATSEALGVGGRWLDMALHTLVADTARAADGVGVAVRRNIGGWVRMLNPPSCGRCAVLAGKFFKWNAGFARHPRCFPPGTVVSGPAALAATRRWYEGELVVLTTASGENLAVTGNHPVLTSRGWLPANLVDEGDDVVRSTRPEGAAALVVPDHDQVPALVEDVWRALGMRGLERVPSAPEDFHGDGRHGEVDVVRADRPLGGRRAAPLGEEVGHESFAFRGVLAERLEVEGATELLDLRRATHPSRAVGGGGLRLALRVGHAPYACEAGCAWAASANALLLQAASDDRARDAVLARERVLAGAGLVGGGDRGVREGSFVARWDAPGAAFTVETRDGYARQGRDLLQRLAGQVELDRVVELRRVQSRGHVYSLTSSEGWHTANSLIVSNCDCLHVPSREDRAGDFRTDPRAAFEAGNVTGLTKAEERAIRDGADIAQVVNARRGMSTADVFGKRVGVTSEGTTLRGVAGKRLADAGLERLPGSRYRSAATPRLTPESIYRFAADRDDAIRLLRRFGYIT